MIMLFRTTGLGTFPIVVAAYILDIFQHAAGAHCCGIAFGGICR